MRFEINHFIGRIWMAVEDVLIDHFGGEYRRYQREVKGLIPFVW